MSQPGIGAMLHALCGGSRHGSSEYYGRKIVAAELVKDDINKLLVTFSDGCQISIWDDAQSCCESRYMTTDDDLSKIIGGTLVRIEAKDGANKEDSDGYGDHEQCFVEIGTNECFVTVCTHNEHNGYYGGFGLTIDEVTAPTSSAEPT